MRGRDGGPAEPATFSAVFMMLRPKQWIKNLFVLAPLLFSGEASTTPLLLKVLAAALLFALASSASYIFNDFLDRERDRLHPTKRHRPIASGRVGLRTAAVTGLAVLLAALVGATLLGPGRFTAVLALYLVVNVGYSLWLKRVVILDVLCVSSGFLLRVLAGGAVTDIYISEWLLLCTITLSLFVAFAKRRQELLLFEGRPDRPREVLARYSRPLLDQILSVVTTTTLISYLLYVTAPRTTEFFGGRNMLFTVPFVLYGIFRYLYLVYVEDQGGDPTELIFLDRPLMITVLGWIGTCMAVIYF